MTIVDLLKEQAEEYGVTCSSYSGRGMFGSQCISISGDDCSDVIKGCIQRIVDLVGLDEMKTSEAKSMVATLLGHSQDSMGRGSVFYWPRVKLEGGDS